MNTAQIAEKSGLSESEVESVIEALSDQLISDLRGMGLFNLFNLADITPVVHPGKEARLGTNPFTGEEQEFKAKPVKIRVKIDPKRKLTAALKQ